MGRSYWLAKSEPGSYSWDDFARDKRTYWDGVRNPQARNNLAQMKKGDLMLFYHSVKNPAVVGIARVVRAAYPDPTSDDERWVVVDVVAVRALSEPVTLGQIKADPRFADLALVRQSRLSVMPVERRHFDRILRLGKTALPARA